MKGIIIAGIGDHLIIDHAGGPQDHWGADPHVLFYQMGLPVATTNSWLNNKFVVAG